MSAKAPDLTGKKFKRLLIIKRVINSKAGRVRYLCLCDCGKTIETESYSIRKGVTQSCGCYQKEKISAVGLLNVKYGLFNHPLHSTWRSMLARCYNKNDSCYHLYGGRGISVCDQWRNDFLSFYDWAIKAGWQKGLQLDRHPNNDGNYEPNNCRVVTPKENANNRRTNVYATINGVRKTASQWSDITGVNALSIAQRIKKGLVGEDAVYGKRLLNKTY